jgi:hypothetical protein
MGHDGSNATGGAFRVPLSVEMAAFDSLGPLGRAALNNARFEFSAESIRQVLAGLEAAWSSPEMDGAVEKIVVAEDAALLTAAAEQARLPLRTLDALVRPFSRRR